MQTVLLILSYPYRLGAQFKNWLYDRRILKPRRAALPIIISIGNITFGGSEKTPLAMELLSFLLEKGYKPALITRGYKGKWERRGGILTHGKRILGTWQDSGDEPFLVAQNTPQAGIFVGKNRWISCRSAMRLRFDIGILDDGFQHRRLHRDLDIVLHDPGIKGPLREPLSSLERAHILLIKSGDNFLKKKFLSEKVTFSYTVSSRGIFQLGGREEVKAGSLKEKKVIAFCGIARPERFLSLLRKQGIIPESFLEFPDHHSFPSASIEKILNRCRRAGADALIMTEKDAVKLASCLPLKKKGAFYLKIGLNLDEAFYTHLFSFIKGKEHPA
jgi:tetraacyldisaccharide 4'-kinase